MRAAGAANGGSFATTHWTVVLAASGSGSEQSDAALAKLCETYWYPLYAYARHQGNGPEDAEDLTQQFFYRLLAKNFLATADRERGKFRTFLLASMKNFLVNEWKRAGRSKRGGTDPLLSFDLQTGEGRYSAEPVSQVVAESLYDRQWAVALVEQVFTVLRAEYLASERGPLLDELKGFVWGEESSASYGEIGARLNMAEGTVKVSVHRLRQRFRQLLRDEVAQTVSRPEEIDGELRHLISVIQ